MKSKLILLFAVLGLALALCAADKPWNEWTVKDAEKILKDSNWSQTQTETDNTEPTYSPGARPIEGRGALNQATKLDFYISFISAKPVRQAYLRLAELNPEKTTADQIEKMRQFVSTKEFEKTICVSVRWYSQDQRFSQSAFQAFSSAITNTLKNDCYLDIKGGKRVFLQEYRYSNLEAKFYFPRSVDDKPIVDAKTGDIRFYAEFPKPSGNNIQVKLDMRFKVAKFLYEGVLEF